MSPPTTTAEQIAALDNYFKVECGPPHLESLWAELKAELERERQLVREALRIAVYTMEHGMPTTEELRQVRAALAMLEPSREGG